MDNQTLVELEAFIRSPWFILVIIWIAIWKGLALWQSARQGQKIWFIVLLVVNTFGLLEIIYLIKNNWVKITDKFTKHNG